MKSAFNILIKLTRVGCRPCSKFDVCYLHVWFTLNKHRAMFWTTEHKIGLKNTLYLTECLLEDSTEIESLTMVTRRVFEFMSQGIDT